MPGSQMSGSQLSGTQMSGSQMSGSQMSGSQMSGSQMSGSQMSGSQMSGSQMSGSQLSGSQLSGSRMAGSQMSGSQLSGSQLSGSQLSGSQLSGSQMSGSQMSGSQMSGSQLSGSQLSGSRMSGSQMSGVSYRRGEFLNAIAQCYCSDACFAQSTYVHDQLIPETPLWLRVGADASASSVDPPPLTADALTETLAAVEPRPGDPVVLDAVAEDLDRLLKISDKPQASEVKEAPKLSTETPAQRPSLAWLDRLVQSTSTATDSAPFATSTASQRADPETAAFAVASDWFTRATRDFLTNRSRPMASAGTAADSVAKATVRLLSNEVATPLATKRNVPSAVKSSSNSNSVKIFERFSSSSAEKETAAREQRRMPPVDSASQVTLRRRVVQEKLAAFVGAAAVKLDGLNCIADDLRQLVDTFKLTSGNIALATPVWEILGWLVLMLLLRRRKELRSAVDAEGLAAQARACLDRRGSSLARLLDETDRLLLDGADS
ncbi:hypothetical protein BOX15_Mlig027431g1 [Macrostomum lignano]|uniref:Uncharacterized protein n=1 Tax=Macrostomum lignano TaxID=282301 RepID=A0A267EU11_9PLAT|nr:hypothetical protein BOX15_Mlig027431g1 [Macrostomum lignano]